MDLYDTTNWFDYTIAVIFLLAVIVYFVYHYWVYLIKPLFFKEPRDPNKYYWDEHLDDKK